MYAAIQAFAAEVTPSPTPTDVDPNLVTPGPWGFAVVAFIGVAVIFLVWDMLRRIRRGRYRAEIREELDAEELAREQAERASEDTAVDDQSVDSGDDDPRR